MLRAYADGRLELRSAWPTVRPAVKRSIEERLAELNRRIRACERPAPAPTGESLPRNWRMAWNWPAPKPAA